MRSLVWKSFKFAGGFFPVNDKKRAIAFYLPQYHPVPENDAWWGKGFTEWTNVAKAKPLFPGHIQPRIPSDLGFYDLRLSETRCEQAELAKNAGIEGFAYWHYWFGDGKQLLELPFCEVLESGKPDFPFCLAWANESWKGFWHGLDNDRAVLIEQRYPGLDDYESHFKSVLPAFRDSRYITVDDKPVFMIYKPLAGDEIKSFIKCWRKIALDNGLKGIFFIGLGAYPNNIETMKTLDLDAINIWPELFRIHEKKPVRKIISRSLALLYGRKDLRFEDYSRASFFFYDPGLLKGDYIPAILTGWDHTPRTGKHGSLLTHYTPLALKKHIDFVLHHNQNQFNLIFLKSWNEWAEGNYLEPDLHYGGEFLQVVHDALIPA
jgi:hypothetical protein